MSSKTALKIENPLGANPTSENLTSENPPSKNLSSAKKKIVFVTGTRADFSKIKSLMQKIQQSDAFELHIFATGMHLSKKFGLSVREIEKCGFQNIFKYINHDKYYQMDKALASTIAGFSRFIAEIEPDLIVVHGDRIEPLAAAIVGSLNNILVAHIEGGEISGTIDDSLRHAISKLSHIHLVNDTIAKNRLLQLGESEDSIFIIGSPDLDILANNTISVQEAKKYYDIDFAEYAIVLFHPVTTEESTMKIQAQNLAQSLLKSTKELGLNYIVVYPNNDLGFEDILSAYEIFSNNKHFKVFPSLRFEYFLALLENAKFIIGNSSCILKEAVFFGVHGILVGSRQNGRAGSENPLITKVEAQADAIYQAIVNISKMPTSHKAQPQNLARPKSADLFLQLLLQKDFFHVRKQKVFKDRF